jgi:hypothetical protein
MEQYYLKNYKGDTIGGFECNTIEEAITSIIEKKIEGSLHDADDNLLARVTGNTDNPVILICKQNLEIDNNLIPENVSVEYSFEYYCDRVENSGR